MFNGQCVFAGKKSFENNCWVEPSTITIVAKCRVATITQSVHIANRSLSPKIRTKLWFLMSSSQPMSIVQCVYSNQLSKSNVFGMCESCTVPGVWVSFKERRGSTSSQMFVLSRSLIGSSHFLVRTCAVFFPFTSFSGFLFCPSVCNPVLQFPTCSHGECQGWV